MSKGFDMRCCVIPSIWTSLLQINKFVLSKTIFKKDLNLELYDESISYFGGFADFKKLSQRLRWVPLIISEDINPVPDQDILGFRFGWEGDFQTYGYNKFMKKIFYFFESLEKLILLIQWIKLGKIIGHRTRNYDVSKKYHFENIEAYVQSWPQKSPVPSGVGLFVLWADSTKLVEFLEKLLQKYFLNRW